LPTGPTARGGVPGAPSRKSGADFEEEERKGKGGPAGPGGRFGGAADRAGRRKARQERAKDRVVSPVPAAALLEGDEDSGRRRGPKRHKSRGPTVAPRKTSAEIEYPITLRSLSEAIGIKANQLMRRMMDLTGQLVTINTSLEEDAAIELAMEFGVELSIAHEETAEDEFDRLLEDARVGETAPEHLQLRPPIVTILGHVDHGKTSLLDYIRKANVVASETGGITQHIGAYQVDHDGHPVTFVDTPGHEAFTAMRARGANVTDIAVVVVAADDGVMPQTKEAIAHAKAAGVQIVVALNKIDLPGVETNLNRILGEISAEGLIPEEYGGDVPVVRTSAVSGLGVDDLLATLSTIAEVYEYKANPDRPATGTCLESEVSEGRGVIATVLVQDGTLRVGDALACGEGFGRVRALFDDKGQPIQEAGPSTPVEISGLDAVPTAGEKFAVLEDIGQAREVAETRRTRSRGVNLGETKAITLENLYSKMAEQKVKSLNVILKADVQGSLEALLKEIEKLENDEVPVRILHKGVGGITESDVMLADASQAIVIGFRVAPEDRAVTLAEEKSIDIRRYDIIYQVSDEIKQAIEGRLEPEIKEVHLGRAVVRQVFKISRGGAGTVAGCFVTQGVIERNGQARIIREGREIYKGAIEALRRFKDDVREVRENFECGIKIAKFDDIKVDDVIEAYRVEVIRRTL
jgi:translation initiation factor IF-2